MSLTITNGAWTGAVDTTGEAGFSLQPDQLTGTSMARFSDAMRAAEQGGVQVAQVTGTSTITDAGTVPATTPVNVTTPVNSAQPNGSVDSTTAAERAVQGLDLGATVDTGPGQSILSGLERLRGVFDSQIGSVNERSTGTAMDVVTMMNIQAEVVQYSVLVDVTSKLAGKSTQALDSLMKGQ